MTRSILICLAFGIIGNLHLAFADQIVYRSENRLKGQLFTFAVMENDLQNVPKWESSAEHPPLSPRKAMAAANQKAKDLLPEVMDGSTVEPTVVPGKDDAHTTIEITPKCN